LWQSQLTRSAQSPPNPALNKLSLAAGDSNSEPLIKNQGQSGQEPNINKKAQLFRSPLAFSSAMEGVCSAQVQAQNKHSKDERLKKSAFILPTAFADINVTTG
jgi:hypothetical protein